MSISVNGAVIPEADLRREIRVQLAGVAAAGGRAANDQLRQAESAASRALVVRELLLQEARTRGYLAGPATGRSADQAQEEAIRRLTETAVPVPAVSEAECQAFFEANRDRFRGPDLFEPSHILFAAPPDGAEARAEAFTAARQALAELERDPDRFEQIARKRSACPSGARGGSLGQITRGETEPPFERHILELEVGAISREPIETDHGFHIVRLDERARGDHLPYEVVADRIRIYLRDRAWRRSMHAFIGELMARAEIEGMDARD